MIFTQCLITVIVWNYFVTGLFALYFILDSRLLGKSCIPVFKVKTTSLFHCLVTCEQKSTCKSVFFMQSSSTCIACSESYYDPEDEAGLVDEFGTVFLLSRYAGYGEMCSNPQRPCNEEHNVCFQGLDRCVCNPLTSVYSRSTGTCVTECSAFGTTFQMYPGYNLVSFSIGSQQTLTLDECKYMCSVTKDTRCFSFDHRYKSGTCTLSYKTVYEAPSKFQPSDRFNIYIRDCK